MIAPWALGYRTGQTIALLMAFDRLLAIWKPTFYAQRQGNYCGLPIELFNYGGLIIVYGAELNGTLNAVIYLVKHQEFKECHKRFIYGIRGKSLHSEHKTTKVFAVVKDTLATPNSPRN
uniref:G-protein coupled receptors family 1 profile domain-containing protein n=1 Tax=Acrobeloides nanus TaxID=290746 RepID=A0A914DXG3_9BILA